MGKKLTHEFVKAAFESAGYEMLGEYSGSMSPIEVRCERGHLRQMSWNAFSRGTRCAICSNKAKLTHDFVASQFKLAGYEILDNYVNSWTKIRFQCPVGHTSQVTWDAFKQGVRCGICNTSKRNEQIRQVALSRRLDHSFVAEQFSLAGYEVLSKYVDSGTPIEIRCERGHTHRISWESFKNGNRCGVCAKENRKTNHPHRLTHDFVKSNLELIGYEMLDKYVNAQTPIKIRCDKGHAHQITWNKFQQGQRCKTCTKINWVNSTPKLDQDFVKNGFELAGYEMLSSYVSYHSKIQFRCNQGHVHEMTWASFSSGSRCEICAKNNRKLKLTHEFVKARFELAGYEMLSDYVNNQTPIEFRCDQGHVHKMTWSLFSSGSRCGICHSKKIYKTFNNRSLTRIIGSIRREIKRQSCSTHWSCFYDIDTLNPIAESIKEFYRNCPKGQNVDHIVPVSAFNLLKKEELIACWDPSNLRYLDTITNIKRQNKMNSEEIEYMRSNYPEIIDAASRLSSLLVRP